MDLRIKCTKTVVGRGSAPDPTGGAYDAPPDPLVGGSGPSAPHFLGACGASVPPVPFCPGKFMVTLQIGFQFAWLQVWLRNLRLD